jgi:hypothetical protein
VAAVSHRDRAQLILVGGLVIAVGLVALAIILNSGIYTHNLASRADPTASETASHTNVVRDSVGGLIQYETRQHPDDPVTQVQNVTAGTANVSAQIAMDSARRGVLTNSTLTATVDGTTVNQTGDRNFTDGAKAADWEVASDAYGVREFRMEVVESSLESSSPPLSSSVFSVTFDSGGDDFRVSVYEDGGLTSVLVTNTDTGRSFGPCTDSGTRTEIDLTGATVAGEHCAALERLADLSEPFDVEFDNADNVTGSYSVVANTTTVGSVGSPGDTGPSGMDTLYAAWVEIRFQSQRVDYRTNVTVAPGEFDG